MSKIDLSKAKIGDKFKDRCGSLYELIYVLKGNCSFRCLLVNEQKDNASNYMVDGSYFKHDMSNFDLVEQVFDESFDTKERDIRTNHEMEKVVEVAKEEKQELQRRQEVISLAEKLVVNEEMMKAHRGLFEAEVHCAKTLTTYPAFVIRSAEDFIKYKNQYLKDGKL